MKQVMTEALFIFDMAAEMTAGWRHVNNIVVSMDVSFLINVFESGPAALSTQPVSHGEPEYAICWDATE